MKNIIIISLGIFLCFTECSCKKDFLNKTDPTQIGTDVFYQNQTQLEQAVSGVYGQLQGIINNQWLFNELPSDNTTVDFNPGDRGQAPSIEAFEFWTINSGTGNIDGMYINYYNALFNINNALVKLKNIKTNTISDSIKAQFQGQLKFLRGYYYFELVQYFGNVVLVTEPLDVPSKAWDYLRMPQAEVYTQIETDLKDAVSLLPVKYNDANVGRVTKGAALTLLGKVYLTQKKYPETISTLQQVLPLGYSLVPDYADAFDPQKKNGSESIFEVQYQGGNNLGEWSSFIYTFAPRLSGAVVIGFPASNPGGWNTPTRDIIAAYENGDLRKNASVGLNFKSPVTDSVVPYIKKYNHNHALIGKTDDNWPVLRYSDVLLMLAEAINDVTGPTSEALGYLNLVRQRAGLAPLSGLSQQSFNDKVLNERRVELAFENWRWFDLKRTKTPVELALFLNAYSAREKAFPTVGRQGIPYSQLDYVFHPYEALYPIPFNEILVNSKLTQNPEY
jgi:hypothetical protein